MQAQSILRKCALIENRQSVSVECFTVSFGKFDIDARLCSSHDGFTDIVCICDVTNKISWASAGEKAA